MGLFKKRTEGPSELDDLKGELVSMRERLDASESDKQHLGGAVRELAARLDETVAAPPPAAPTVDPGDLDLLRARVQRLSDRVEHVAVQTESTTSLDPSVVEQLRAHLDGVAARVDGLADAPSRPTVDPAQVDELRESVRGLVARLDTPSPPPPPPPSGPVPAPPAPTAVDDQRLDELSTRLDHLLERIEQVDVRVTSISTELANQLSELSGELDGIEGGDGVATGEIVGELRDGQERLANEQARYQIAFRQDLASLADRLRRS